MEKQTKQEQDAPNAKPPTTPLTDGEGDEAVEHVPLYRMRRVVIPAALVLLAAVGGAWYWYANLRDFASSDDAYIDANRASISSKMLGRVARLTVDEGDTVTKGELLVQLDDSDLRAQREQADASLKFAQESVTLAKVNMGRADEDFRRAEQQYHGAVVTKEQFDHARNALDAARAEYGIALSRVGTARAQVGVVQSQLNNCTIVSPVDGKVARRWILPGDVVQPGQPMLSVYDRSRIWVTANLEETSLHLVRTGEDVEIAVDTHPDRRFRGTVFQIGSSTAAQFSLIPPNNASGNFTKITQRVPVKISIVEQIVDGRAPAELLPGMSVEVRIRIR